MAKPTGAERKRWDCSRRNSLPRRTVLENSPGGRPRRAHLAVAAALETAATQYGAEDHGFGVPESLQPFIVHRSSDEKILGTTETAERLEASRITV